MKSVKVQTTADKIKEISAKFDMAEEIVSDEVTEVIEDAVTEIVEAKQNYHPIDVMSVEQMAMDFKFSRETLQESIGYGRMVLENATQELLSDSKNKASNTMAFAELTTAVLNGVKVHSQLYKDFSTVLVNIKRVLEGEAPKVVNNTVNLVKDISTVDLIEQIKKIK